VHFLGSRGDVPQLLCECAVLVHTARQEPLGRVLLEAAACGLPVIATDVGGTREIFPGADGAVLVPPDSPAAVANAVAALVQNSSLRQSLGGAGWARAAAAFDVREAASRLIDLYGSVLKL
jgi:glycosyltransferase involved in cell wall biosynthesis